MSESCQLASDTLSLQAEYGILRPPPFQGVAFLVTMCMNWAHKKPRRRSIGVCVSLNRIDLNSEDAAEDVAVGNDQTSEYY